MPDQKPQNGELLDNVTLSEAESVKWVTLHLQQTVRFIGIKRSETLLIDLFVIRFRRMQRRRHLHRIGVGLASGIGLVFGADVLVDIEWLGWINALLNWVGRSLVFEVGELWMMPRDWLA